MSEDLFGEVRPARAEYAPGNANLIALVQHVMAHVVGDVVRRGYLEGKRIHDLCQKCGVPVWCGGMLETGIGRAANVALAAVR